MRKALIGLILAATAITPAATWAQDWHHDGGRGGHNDGGQRGQRQAQAPRQAQQAPQYTARPRGDNNVARGNWQGRQQNYNGNWQGRGQQNNYQGNTNRGNYQGRQNSIYPQAWQGNPNDPRLRNYENVERRNQQNYGGRGGNDGGKWRDGNRGGNRDGANWNRGGNRDGANWDRGGNRGGANWNRGGNRGGANWNRGWRNDNRYDWRGWRNNNRGLFHVGPYYSPYRGYGYNRFSIGVFLDPFFYDQRYWIGDPWEYRLPPAEPGTEWVRYYNDVLLVDVETGEVLDTIYDFFW
jgi:nickel/cobalt transporter regulator